MERNGQMEWNKEGRLQGGKNSELTELGIRQAELLGEKLNDEKIDVIYTSNLQRAYRTAEIIENNKGIKIIIDENLGEIRWGDWEGLKHEEIRAISDQYDVFWNKPHLYEPTTGESFDNFKKRVLGSITNIIKQNDNKNVSVVVHGVVAKQILNFFENKPLEKFWDPPFMHSTSLSIIEIDEDIAEIKLYADTSHNVKKNDR